MDIKTLLTMMLNDQMKSIRTSKATPGQPKSGKTRRGATHKHNTVFKGRQILPMSPAQYRRYHFGSQKDPSKGKK